MLTTVPSMKAMEDATTAVMSTNLRRSDGQKVAAGREVLVMERALGLEAEGWTGQAQSQALSSVGKRSRGGSTAVSTDDIPQEQQESPGL